MALLSPPPVLEPMERIQYHNYNATTAAAAVACGGEIEEDENRQELVDEEKIYVAVGKNVKENKLTLSYALQHSQGKRICLLHVHQPAKMIPMPLMGGKFPPDKLNQEEVTAYRDVEKKTTQDILNDYLKICSREGVRPHKLHVEMDNIEKGIIHLIERHRIKTLVMGAAADKHYTKKMTTLKSKKAIFVNQQAQPSCHISFVCNGILILTRDGGLNGTEIVGVPHSPLVIATPRRGNLSRSHSEGKSDYAKLSMVQAFIRRVGSHGGRVTTLSTLDEIGEMSSLQGQLTPEKSIHVWDGTSVRSPSQVSTHSTMSSNEEVDARLESLSFARNEESEDGEGLSSLHELEEDARHSSPLPKEWGVKIEMLDKLQEAMAEAENSAREVFEESVRRRKAEKDAMEARLKAKASESVYANEVRRRKELEEALERETLELNKIKIQRDEVVNEFRTVVDQKLVLESQLADSDRMVKVLEEKIICAVDLLISTREERDELLLERDNAAREAGELKKGMTRSQRLQHTSEFSFSEIEEATRSFDLSLMIGGGGYGSVYKGFLRNTEVAIKLLESNSLQGHSEFQQEVDVLSRVRHPNLVTLIGACPEAFSLIYEYLPNGSLEDRLICKDNSPPLSWQRRICIAVDVCSALIFLHSSKPDSIIHGDIKPANILLDANFVGKLGDFGICRLVSKENNSTDTTTPCCITNPKGTLVYLDPEFLATGQLTAKSDVYSFGIILLRLLTGKPALGLVKEVQYALDKGNLSAILDEMAGDWPFVQARQLAHLALRCCEMNRKSRPDLNSEVWRVLEPMKASCGASPSFRLGSDEHQRVPSYFICPILQEIMRDPHIAADGFTYEAEALKAWLDSGHSTSPMTNLKLPHCNLVPNHSLHSAIEEWMQTH